LLCCVCPAFCGTLCARMRASETRKTTKEG
jgi:hypothetical protein